MNFFCISGKEIISIFYEKEQPETVIVKSGELRLFRNSQRLGASKNSEGVHMGKTVTIDLAANKGNQEMIELFERVIDILQADNSAQDNK